MPHQPSVSGLFVLRVPEASVSEIATEDPIVPFLPDLATVTCLIVGDFLGSRASRQRKSLGLFGGLGDDVDNAIDCIRPPNGAARTANHFDPLDVVKRNVHGIPKDSGGDGVVDRPSIDQDQHFVGVDVVKAADADGPAIALKLRHINPWNHSQQVGNVGTSLNGGFHPEL